MNLNYKELYEKYRLLEKENKLLKDEISLLKVRLTKDKSEPNSSMDFTIIKEVHV